MGSYSYRAYDQSGRLVEGRLDSDTRADAIEALRRQGALPIEIEEASGTRVRSGFWSRLTARPAVSDAALAMLTRELATLLAATLPLDDALRLIALQPSLDARTRRLVASLLTRVLGGDSLSRALQSEPGAFPEYYWNLVAAGERSGGIAAALASLATFLERRAAFRTKLRDALVYPAVLLAAAVVAMSVVVGVLVPAIAPLFDEAGSAPPPVIAVLRDLQLLVAAHWPLVIAAAALAIALLVAGARSASMRRRFDRLALRLPLIGRLIARRETARFSGTLATLLSSGVPMLDAVRLTTAALSNDVYRDASAALVERLAEGGVLSEEMAANGLYGELALRMTAIGERSGDVAPMLARLARIEEEALQRDLERLSGLVAPVLTVAIGLAVGAVILSVMDAVLGLNELAFR